MAETKRADLLKEGESFEPLEFTVTSEWNDQFRQALEANYSRYERRDDSGSSWVVPGLLIGNSNITRSPSFRLDPGMAAVHTKEEVDFMNPARVGKKLKVTWDVTAYYEKRGRPFQVVDCVIVDEDQNVILQRKITDTFMGGPYPGVNE